MHNKDILSDDNLKKTKDCWPNAIVKLHRILTKCVTNKQQPSYFHFPQQHSNQGLIANWCDVSNQINMFGKVQKDFKKSKL